MGYESLLWVGAFVSTRIRRKNRGYDQCYRPFSVADGSAKADRMSFALKNSTIEMDRD